MADHDRLLIDPGRADLERALKEAARAANARARSRTLPWPLAELGEALVKVERESEGWRQWVSDGGRVRSGEACSVLLLAWWSDRLGRKHHRLVARRGAFSPGGRKNVLSEGEERAALWLAYPENTYLRERGKGRELFVVCPCGAAGAPEEVGWVGPCCGPCHDRQEGGEPLPRWDRELVLTGHAKAIDGVAFRPDGKQLVSRGYFEESILLWGLGGEESDDWTSPGWPLAFAYSPDGGRLAVGGNWGTVYVLAPARRETVCQPPAPGWPVQALAFSPDGTELAVSVGRSSYGGEGNTTFWDARTGEARGTLPPYPVRARCLAYSPDGRHLAAALRDKSIVLYDARTREPKRELSAGRPGHFWLVSSLGFSPDSQSLAAVDHQGAVHRWALVGEEDHRVLGQTGSESTVAFSPDGTVLASAGSQGVLRFFSHPEGRELAAFRWHGESITALAVSSDGQWLATGGPDRVIKLWPWSLMLGR